MAPHLDAIDWPLRTERLTIRPATRDDTQATWAYRRLEEVGRWITRAPTDFVEYDAAMIPDYLDRTLVFERDGEVIGDLMLHIEDAWGQTEVAEQTVGVQAEIGWVLHPDHGGRGYATEAVRALIRLCFTDLGLRRVTANCFAAHEPSWRLMERVGMRREVYAVRDSLHRTEGWLDGVGYALLADEWRAAGGGGGGGEDLPRR